MKRTNIQELPGFHYLVNGRHGTFVANRNDKFVGGALITYGEFSELETDFFKSVVNDKTTVIEVGANIGAHTVWLAKNAKRVIAIEPQPFVYYTLCANIVLNSLQNVECLNIAVGQGSEYISVPKLDQSQLSNFGGVELRNFQAKEYAQVPLVSLDEIFVRYGISGQVFLKIDVEGMELEVLKSGTTAIKAIKPFMYVENDRPEKSNELLAYIKSLGYLTRRHEPTLFNPKNFFGKKDNKFVHPSSGLMYASFNEICTPL